MPKRQSMVIIPFLGEDPLLVARTLRIAASHPRVGHVIGVHGDVYAVSEAVKHLVPGYRIMPQKRFGVLRPGKGDAINTGFEVFLSSSCDRLHFYDADIKSFDSTWIDQAESKLDQGFETVRHFYPRAATDGMITAMVVRPGFAMRWPGTALARIKQPLSGEVAFARPAIEAIAPHELVRRQSDWGIDTVITAVSVELGLSLAENFVAVGKDHQLYGSLDDLRVMYGECLAALRVLAARLDPPPIVHHVDEAEGFGSPVTDTIAFDYAVSQRIIAAPLSPSEVDLLSQHFSPDVGRALATGDLKVFDTATWLDVLAVLISQATTAPHWNDLAFRLWVARVLHFAEAEARHGYEHAVASIEAMVERAMLHTLN